MNDAPAKVGPRVPEIEALARRFQDCGLSREEWTHEAHLAVGLWHVARYGPTEALPRLRRGIRRLNESNGVANSATGGYHETITHAYVTLLAAFVGQRTDVQAACDELLAGPLAARDALLRFYSRELLFSPGARAAWAEPDRAPLAW